MKTNLKELSEEFGQNLKLDCDLKKKNWFNIGGKAKIYFKPDNFSRKRVILIWPPSTNV